MAEHKLSVIACWEPVPPTVILAAGDLDTLPPAEMADAVLLMATSRGDPERISLAQKITDAVKAEQYGKAMLLMWNLSKEWGWDHGRYSRRSEDERINGGRRRQVRAASEDPANREAYDTYCGLISEGMADKAARDEALKRHPDASREALKKRIARNKK